MMYIGERLLKTLVVFIVVLMLLVVGLEYRTYYNHLEVCKKIDQIQRVPVYIFEDHLDELGQVIEQDDQLNDIQFSFEAIKEA